MYDTSAMFIEDEDGDIQKAGFSFATMEKIEAQKSSASLLSIDVNLFSPPDSSDDVVTEDNLMGGSLLDENIRKYYSEGYEANHSGVDANEIKRWQSAFDYLRIQGFNPSEQTSKKDQFNEIEIRSKSMDENVDENYIVDEIDCIDENSLSQLIIVGETIKPQPFHIPSNRSGQLDFPVMVDDEEILCQNGILEEYIEYNIDDSHNSNMGGRYSDISYTVVDPVNSKREEIMISLLETIWEDTVIPILRPLVQRVVIAADEHNIANVADYGRKAITSSDKRKHYVENNTPCEEIHNGISMSGFDFASNDDW